MTWVLTRREFLRLGTLTVGGLWAAVHRFPLTAWAAPEVPFRDPPPLDVRRPEPGLVEGTLIAREQWVDLGFRKARLLTYNGSLPGPLLRLRSGETVRLRFINNLKEATNLHYHGLHIPPTGRADNVFLYIPPGEGLEYEFTLPQEAQTAWYHPHTFRPPAAIQAFAGMAGPIVVEGDLDRVPELRAAEEHVVALKDVAFQGDRPAPHTTDEWGEGKEGDYILVNGRLQPTLRVQRRLLRLRFINMSNARHYRLRLDPAMAFHLIATDGGFIEKPVELEEVVLVPGERADVLIRFDRPGRYRLVNLFYPRGTYLSKPANSLLMTVDVPEGLPDPPSVPSRLGSVPRIEVDPRVPTRTIEFGLWLINGRFIDPSHQRADVETRLGQREVWELWNNHPVDHPFHLHTFHFQVLDRNGVPEPFPAWHDTIPFRPNERIRIAVAFEDFGGKTLFHCHIMEHVAMGMMALLQVNA